ncbi:MAG: SMP-30/gluconolactonase/LRE family protein [Chloroflexi bacterium]|nr:SMP-30/gluconolactonase/LRE family protein [Chloroflexota bacterium]
MPILQLSPDLAQIVAPDQEIEELGSGYQVAEGPLWWQEEVYLLFNEVRGNRRRKWTPTEGVSLLQEPSNNANGLTRDLQGRLILCEGGARRVTRVEDNGNITVVADGYQGKRLNRPNDVVVKSDGSIYFTDPGAPDPDLELDFSGVYRVSPDLATITLLIRDIVFPNGLAFSPDESILYIDDYRRGHIRAFDIQPNGTLALATDRVFCSLREPRPIGPDGPDGMKVDVEGNVYCTGPGGVWVLNQEGKHLGTILTGAQTTNVGWGGTDWKTLFITTFGAVGRIRLNIAGVPVPHPSHGG